MQITAVEIRNFRAHAHLELNLRSKLAIVGENSTGKTTVLEALHLATRTYLPRSSVDESMFHLGCDDDIVIWVCFDKYYICEVQDGYTTQKIPCQSNTFKVSHRSRASAGKLLSDPLTISNLCEPIQYAAIEELDADLLPDDVGIDQLPTSVVVEEDRLRARRRGGTDFRSSLSFLSITNKLLGYPDSYYFRLNRDREAKTGFNSLMTRVGKELQWRYRRELDTDPVAERWEEYYDVLQDSISGNRLDVLLNPLSEQLREITGLSLEGLELSVHTLEQPFSKSFLALRQGLHQEPLGSLGSGVEFIAVLLLLKHISEQSRNPVVILIDEPELHLHPELQERLFRFLSQAEGQVIYTTHSDCFVDLGSHRTIKRFSIARDVFPTVDGLRRQVAGSSVEDHLNDLSRYYQNHTVLRREDGALLFARKVLLVEGPFDKYAVAVSAQLADSPLTEVSIFTCNGKDNIKFYATLCFAYGVDAMVLFDRDGLPLEAAENQSVIEACLDLPHFSLTSSMEEVWAVENQRKSAQFAAVDQATVDDVPNELSEFLAFAEGWASG